MRFGGGVISPRRRPEELSESRCQLCRGDRTSRGRGVRPPPLDEGTHRGVGNHDPTETTSHTGFGQLSHRWAAGPRDDVHGSVNLTDKQAQVGASVTPGAKSTSAPASR